MSEPKTTFAHAPVLLLLILLPLAASARPRPDARPATAAANDAVSEPTARRVTPGRLPLMFIESRDPQTGHPRFQLRQRSRTIWVQDGVIWITLMPPSARPVHEFGSAQHTAASAHDPQPGAHLRLSFVGAESDLHAEPFAPLPTRVNTLRGNDPRRWQTNQPVWSGVRYPNLYPGIDLVIAGEDGRLRPHLVAAPGAAVDAVRLRVEGADGIAVESDRLHFATAAGDFFLPFFPVVTAGGAPYDHPLPAPHLNGPDVIAAPLVAAKTGAEPAVPEQFDIFYSTFLDGTGITRGYGIDVDPNSGFAYITGATTASDFPTTPGAFDAFYNGQIDAFVALLGSGGDALGFATFIGGELDDYGYAVDVGQSGFIYVTGTTRSADFPTTDGAYDRSHNGSDDIFVLTLNPQGSALMYSTLVGGADSDVPWDIAVNALEQAFVAGSTLSDPFPTTPGAFQTSYGGNRDAFVLKVNEAGSDLLYSTYLGGSSFDEILGLALDGDFVGGPAVVVTGGTQSANFPTTDGVLAPDHNGGGFDAFLTRLEGDGANLTTSTFLGGSAGDLAYDVAVDSTGFRYVSGMTSSADFPTTAGAYDRTLDGPTDSFVTRVNFAASALGYATYLGGSEGEGKAFVAVDDLGMAHITGETWSPDFPVTAGGSGNRNCGFTDAYALRLSATGSALGFGIVLGGSSPDNPVGAAVYYSTQSLHLYYTGYTESADFPTTPGAFDTDGDSSPSAIAVRLGLPIAFHGEIGTRGGELDFGDFRYEFGPGTYTSDVFIIHTPTPENPTLAVCGVPGNRPATSAPLAPDDVVTVGEPFDVTAAYSDTMQLAPPSRPFTLTVSYDEAAAVEDTLALYRWDGQQWALQPGAALDPDTNTVTAALSTLGTYAVRGETVERPLYLPLITGTE